MLFSAFHFAKLTNVFTSAARAGVIALEQDAVPLLVADALLSASQPNKNRMTLMQRMF